jgi:hypothetical protein
VKSRLVGLVSAVALAAGVGAVGFTQSASAGQQQVGAAPLTVLKSVSGPVPAGTTFTAKIQCDDAIIFVQGGDSADNATVTFGADGQPTSPDTVTFDDPGQCDVTETVTGGAATTTYACDGSIPPPPSTTTTTEVVPKSDVFPSAVVPDDPICEAAGPQATPITVNIEDEHQVATVTIANTFVAPTPQPAAQIVAKPAFTG